MENEKCLYLWTNQSFSIFHFPFSIPHDNSPFTAQPKEV